MLLQPNVTAMPDDGSNGDDLEVSNLTAPPLQ